MHELKDTYTIPEGMRERLQAEYPCLGYRGNVKAHPSACIAENCQIVGKVTLGERSIVYEGAILRADSNLIHIGAETNIQENCILHESVGFPLVIGDHSTVGHGAILHGCSIGDNSLIGMGAVVLDGAVIGNNCVVGAGAVVPQGMEVPDYHMAVGVPAKLRGPLSQERVDVLITEFSEVNLIEAQNLLEAGLMHHPTDELLRKVGAMGYPHEG